MATTPLLYAKQAHSSQGGSDSQKKEMHEAWKIFSHRGESGCQFMPSAHHLPLLHVQNDSHLAAGTMCVDHHVIDAAVLSGVRKMARRVAHATLPVALWWCPHHSESSTRKEGSVFWVGQKSESMKDFLVSSLRFFSATWTILWKLKAIQVQMLFLRWRGRRQEHWEPDHRALSFHPLQWLIRHLSTMNP